MNEIQGINSHNQPAGGEEIEETLITHLERKVQSLREKTMVLSEDCHNPYLGCDPALIRSSFITRAEELDQEESALKSQIASIEYTDKIKPLSAELGDIGRMIEILYSQLIWDA